MPQCGRILNSLHRKQRETNIAKVATIKTRSDAATYLASVMAKRSAAVDHAANR